MEKLRITDVIEANKAGIRNDVRKAVNRLAFAQKVYPDAILRVVNSGNLARQIELTRKELQNNPRADVDRPLSSSAGVYFGNEDVIGGSRVGNVLKYINAIAKDLGIPVLPEKIKLGPGIGFVEAPNVYQVLSARGIGNAGLTLNYNAPGGTAETRIGIKGIVDAKIDPDGDFFPDDGVFLTQGATEAIDLFMNGLAALKSSSRIVFLGLSYYTGLFSAMQKGLTIDRLIKNPIDKTSETKFFPTPEQISTSIPNDTSALVLTMPNNPNGETYSNGDLTKIIQIAKERGIFILFDAIFENMYFDENQNFQSSLLKTANELAALDNIVIVDSLSKTMNFPGERVGYFATTNRNMINAITNIRLAQVCNPRLPQEPLLQFEGLARRIKAFRQESPGTRVETIIDKVFNGNGASIDKTALLQMYTEWETWNNEALKFYKDNLELVKIVLNGSISASSPDKAAFNTFVKLQGLPAGTNNVDFLAKLMFTMATYTQIGPCFGLSQKTWDRDLGVWPRITYACGRDDLIEGLVRLITFTKFYAEKNFGDPNKFPVLQISYDQQI